MNNMMSLGRFAWHNARIRLGAGMVALVFISLWAGASAVHAEEPPIVVSLNDQKVIFQEQPLLLNGTTFVQIRPLFEALGIEMKWDAAKKVVHGSKQNLTFSMPVGGKEATVNGKRIQTDVSPIVRNGHTLVPLRLIGESAELLVLWDGYNRVIYMFADPYLQQKGLTREAVTQGFEIHQQQEKEKRQKQQPTPSKDPKPGDGGSDSKLKTPQSLEDIKHLKGMYYGYRLDVGGYQCGGVCWPKYTFLNNQRLFVGEPPAGGPETINCSTDDCLTYTLKDGKLILSNGKSYTIRLNEAGEPVIGDVPLTKVAPVQAGLKLNGTYTYYSSGPLASGTESFTFKSDGTFTRSKKSGTYTIQNNTITFTYSDGQERQQLFFLHHGKANSIQINSKNYNLK
ncbi:stalk domain-containing protein [Paenibacillus piscarius]|uniref:stalk domain-containing protein n=1 Tax=Paenibacillus piscarius TaxID=1089681 RepID=UPI001EE94B0E|nr:stalk domain-containing protein [Paenibacillus piscarius]